MTTVSTTKSNVLGAALVTAAMALPSVEFAYAEAAPERGIISFKYLNYQEHQSAVSVSGGDIDNGNDDDNDDDDDDDRARGVTYDMVSGASAAPVTPAGTSGSIAEADRIDVSAYSIYGMVPIAGEWSVGVTYTADLVSGASPRYHSAALTEMEDDRYAIDVQVSRYFPKGVLSASTSYSSESDYESRSYALQGSLSTEDKNTTFTIGAGYTDDSINPSNLKVVDEKKHVFTGLLGVTRVLSKQDIVQLNFGYSSGSGYYSDPYKDYDNRPDDRNSVTVLGRWNHHFNGIDGTARMSYRYYSDSFGIRAHTLGLEYVQPLMHGWTVTPLLRLYSQNEADFYLATNPAAPAEPTIPPVDAVFYTEDQRMGAFGAVTLGLKVSKQLSPDWLVDVKYEHYEQRSGWSLAGEEDPGLADFSARSIQLGISRFF
jgi:hypothetical protein